MVFEQAFDATPKIVRKKFVSSLLQKKSMISVSVEKLWFQAAPKFDCNQNLQSWSLKHEQILYSNKLMLYWCGNCHVVEMHWKLFRKWHFTCIY